MYLIEAKMFIWNRGVKSTRQIAMFHIFTQ